MAKAQAIKGRIGSVKSTKQITKAMELVAASKLRRAQEASLRSRTYRNSAREILAKLSKLTDAGTFELFQQRPVVHSRLYVVFTSDRGLAGAYNSNIFKLLLKCLERDKEEATTSKVIVIGRKGAQMVSKLEGVELVGAYEDWPTYPHTRDISPLFHSVLEQFKDGSADEVSLLFTDFISSINQEAKTQTLLPASLEDEVENVIIRRHIDDVVFEPSPQRLLEKVVPRLVEIQLLQAALEASASEQSMRMLAMKNASDNANDLIDDLTLAFNSARQAAITQELAEITGGAAAIS